MYDGRSYSRLTPDDAMAEWKLFTFGPPRLERDGQPVELNLRKALALLVYLTVTAQPQSRDVLATLLWPESNQREARGGLRRTLHRLNEAIGDALLDCGPEAIRLHPAADVWLDCATFQQQATAGLRTSVQDEFAPERLAPLEAAIALYREDFLQGFTLPDSPAFDDWQFFQREGLRQRYGQVLAQLVHVHHSRHAWDAAIGYARKWVALDRLHEPAHRLLMRLYAGAGQPAAALRQYQEYRRLVDVELGAVPEDETTALFEAIRTKQFAPPAEHTRTIPVAPEAPPAISGALRNALPRAVQSTPVPGTTLVGRKRERIELAGLLGRDDVRLVTLTGPGGVGKTRLVLAVADAVQARFADGVVFVGLQALSDATLVLPTIAQALDVIEQGDQRLLTSVQTALQDRQVLLVLDNFEQVLAAGAQVAELLLGVPTLKVLVTSRAALRLQAERVIFVEPLAVPHPPPPPLDELWQYEAVQLFMARAQAAKADFQMTNANAPAVAEICAHLDGLPLAIELAAPRVRILTPEILSQRLRSRLKVLTGGAHDLPARQQTLRATLDWSYHLLDRDEQTLFARLAVFVGGWTLPAAETICAAEHDRLAVLDGLQSLVEKSLVHQVDQSGSTPRFVMLETIREYALERLAESDTTETVRRSHTQHYLALAEQAEPELVAAQSTTWLARLDVDHANLRAAIQWTHDRAETSVALRLVGALWRFWKIRGHLSEGRMWLGRVLDSGSTGAGKPEHWANALNGMGALAFAQADYAMAAQYHEQALNLYRELQDRKGTALTLNDLAIQMANQGDGARAYSLFTECLALLRELGEQQGLARALVNLAVVVLDHQGDYARSQALSEEALPLSQALGNTWGTANILSNLGLALLLQGEEQRALDVFKQGLRLFRELGDIAGMAECIEGLALMQAQRAPDRLVQLYAFTEHQRTSIGAPRAAYLSKAYRPYLAAAQARIGAGAWAARWAEGWAMTLEQAVAFLLEEAFPPAPATVV